MEPSAFEQAAIELYGKFAWQHQVAKALGLTRTTIWRYAKGHRAIPPHVALALKALALEPRS